MLAERVRGRIFGAETAPRAPTPLADLYLSTNYVDRFLSTFPVMRGRLQLVGVTCMLIASKYEEIFAPRVEDFVYITDSTYSETEVLQMEVTGMPHRPCARAAFS